MSKMDIFWCVVGGLIAGALVCDWVWPRFREWRALRRNRRLVEHMSFPLHIPRGRQRHG